MNILKGIFLVFGIITLASIALFNGVMVRTIIVFVTWLMEPEGNGIVRVLESLC